MEWGFGLAIVGIIIILIATIWYFATQSMTIIAIPALGNNPVIGPDGKPLTRTVPGVGGQPATVVTLTGNTILVKEAIQLLTPSYVAIGGWILGSLMVIGGTIWGLISRSKAKPESRTAKLLDLLYTHPPPATTPTPPPRSVSPSPSTGLSAEELAKLRAILNASA